jgi:ubiquinone/menaquinone biosynthesis C-methylase UbiE
MGAEDNQPDWNRIAEKFDIWLPQIAPVGEALLNSLDIVPGDRVLDLASGTGEPALTLARRNRGDIEIVGIDSAEGMVRVAQAKVGAENLSGIRFECMPAEDLRFADNSFDRVLCRFGVMLFESPAKGLAEMRRVLKPGGQFALTVWGTPETMPTLYWAYEVFRDRIEADLYPPLIKVTSLGGLGVLDELLDQTGFSEYVIESQTFQYQFDSFDEYWDAVEASEILKQQFDALASSEREAIRDEVGAFARNFVTDHGLRIPHDFLLGKGIK